MATGAAEAVEVSTLTSTSLATVLSSAHGRLRRQQRNISKGDLASAVKYGKREETFSPRTGARNWKFTFADIVYITDESMRHEITSWPVPGVGIDMPLAAITPAMEAEHLRAQARIRSDPSRWTSHSVIVVDQSGSMRKDDVADGITRSDAVWVTVALSFVLQQIESGQAKATDVVSIIALQSDSALLVDRAPVDWHLFNFCVHQLRSAVPKEGGNYQPALDLAETCLLRNTVGSCALLLLFFSDGRPSDRLPKGDPYTSPSDKFKIQMSGRVGSLASRLGRRLTVAVIGFSKPQEDFSVLREMARVCKDYGAGGIFQNPDLNSTALRLAVSTVSATLTATKTEMTELAGPSGGGPQQQRTVRDVRRESAQGAAAVATFVDPSWRFYSDSSVVSCQKWSLEKRDWVMVDRFATPEATSIAVKDHIFGEGAERMVRKLREVGPDGVTFVGPHLVAKESRFTEDHPEAASRADRRKFHRIFCETQGEAQKLADKFNERLNKIPGVGPMTPRIRFLACYVLVVADPRLGEIGLLVEKMLDPLKYKKFNSNNGFVDGQQGGGAGLLSLAALGLQHDRGTGPLNLIAEDEEVDSDEDYPAHSIRMGPPPSAAGAGGGLRSRNPVAELPPLFAIADIPQAFTHFSYWYSSRRMMVCDLQGVLNETETPPVFELTDPVVHYKSRSGRTNVFGRSDRGRKGVDSFFRTHTCSELCKAVMGAHWITCEDSARSRPTTSSASGAGGGGAARSAAAGRGAAAGAGNVRAALISRALQDLKILPDGA